MFQLTFERSDWTRYHIEGRHEWSLPPVACDRCGATWKTTGEAYPTVDVGTLAATYRVESVRALPIAEFTDLRFRLLSSVPPGAPVAPGADFGVFSGTARGVFPDFAWGQKWTMFFQLDVAVRLRMHGVNLPKMAPVKLKTSGRNLVAELLEPEALPLFDFARAGLKDPLSSPCERCGRLASGFRELLIDPGATLPPETDLCRGRNNPAIYVVSDRFAEAVRTLGLTGCMLKELATVSGE